MSHPWTSLSALANAISNEKGGQWIQTGRNPKPSRLVFLNLLNDTVITAFAQIVFLPNLMSQASVTSPSTSAAPGEPDLETQNRKMRATCSAKKPWPSKGMAKSIGMLSPKVLRQNCNKTMQKPLGMSERCVALDLRNGVCKSSHHKAGADHHELQSETLQIIGLE